jgi:hypothetical protein
MLNTCEMKPGVTNLNDCFRSFIELHQPNFVQVLELHDLYVIVHLLNEVLHFGVWVGSVSVLIETPSVYSHYYILSDLDRNSQCGSLGK